MFIIFGDDAFANFGVIEIFLIRVISVGFFISLIGVISAIYGSCLPGGLGTVLDSFFSAEKTEGRDKEETERVDALKIQGSAKINPTSVSTSDIEYLTNLLKQFGAENSSAYLCLGYTLAYFLIATYFMHKYPSWWSILLMGTFNVRAFIIFHDACHMSFFNSASSNKMLAKVMAIFVPQNVSDWTSSHNFHHSHLGDSSFMDLSLTIWFNKKEYEEMPFFVKLGFRIIRDPILLPMILSSWVFMIFPFIKSPSDAFFNRLAFYVPCYCILGSRTALLFLIASWIGGMIGLQLFHLQHQCNSPYRVDHLKHSMWDAGMVGSTHLLVPWPLTLMTLGIEYHHIHHASTRVPCYNLAKCHDEGEKVFGLGWKLVGVNRVGITRAFFSSFHCLFEDTKVDQDGKLPVRFVSFEPYQFLGLHD